MKCPSCSAPLPYEQRFATLAVCEHCYSAVVFDDAVAKVAGKMAALSQPSSGLYIGATGRIGDELVFRCLGRVRYAYGRGFWDEWYLGHDDQSSSWLSEDEQKLIFDRPKRHKFTQTQLQSIRPGALIDLEGQRYQVMESDVAICEGGEGQLPFRIVTGERVPFFDLQNAERQRATLEIEPDGTLKLFTGQTIAPSDLRLDAPRSQAPDDSFATPAPESRQRVHYGSGEAVTIRCKQCGASNIDPKLGKGPVHCRQCGASLLDDPPSFACVSCEHPITCSSAEVKSVHCPACGTAQRVQQGTPTLLSTIQATQAQQAQNPHPLALGDKAEFDGLTFQLVGYLRYTEEEEGETYSSDEYLLYNESWGYRWLSYYETHWSLQCKLEHLPLISPSGIDHLDYHDRTKIDDQEWQFYESGRGRIEWIQGEFPWVAQVGDESSYLELISPPHMLVRETNDTELEWSKFRYLDRDTLAQAFGKQPFDFPSPVGLGACQPNRSQPFFNTAALICFVFALISFGLRYVKPGTPIKTLHFDEDIYSREVLSEPFEIKRDQVVHSIKFESKVYNQWVSLDWAMVSKDDTALFTNTVDISYYYGTDYEGRWSEGSHRRFRDFKVPKGQYRLLVAGVGGDDDSDSGLPVNPDVVIPVKVPVKVTIIEDTWGSTHYFVTFAIALVLLSFLLLFIGALTESRRWSHTTDDDED